MTSFAMDVRNEIARVIPDKLCCKRSELASLLRMSRANFVSESEFSFSTSNAAIARKILLLSNAIDPEIETRVERRKAYGLRKNNRYIIYASRAEKISSVLNIFEGKMIRRDCCRKSFLRGAFLGSGSINKPESKYHFELTSREFIVASFIVDLLNHMDFSPKLCERGKKFIVYLNESESILDFLSMVNANRAAERFESARNLKEIRGRVNMIVNLETSNMQRSAEATSRQLEDIDKLENSDQIQKLSNKLIATINIRKENPESSMSELAEILQISKSGIDFRFRKIHELASKI